MSKYFSREPFLLESQSETQSHPLQYNWKVRREKIPTDGFDMNHISLVAVALACDEHWLFIYGANLVALFISENLHVYCIFNPFRPMGACCALRCFGVTF